MITTEEIVNDWAFVSNTEANGKHYHDEESDMSAVVYARKTKVFSCRRRGIKGNYPCAYSEVTIIK